MAAAERRLFERLAHELDGAWMVIHDCEIRAHGEVGTVEFLLIHRDFGVALLGIAEPDEEADAGLAAAAMRTMLDDLGFSRRFPGRLAVVATTLRPQDKENLRTVIERAFAASPAGGIADPTWADWLFQRLAPSAAAPAAAEPQAVPKPEAPRLRAPSRDDAWRVVEAARAKATEEAIPKVGATAEPILASEAAAARPTSWVGMGLAIIVVSIVLLGMALLSHGNG
ncbi:MAG TPA: hypothetical protein VFA50_05315 [Stellaceae bacterium]|nr:hypothetical protein [Stellaceae bacterium]